LPKAEGCGLSAADAESGIRQLDPSVDLFADLRLKLVAGRQKFGVRPTVRLIDDTGSPNAYATPRVYSPEGPDGTVLFGLNLLREIDAMESFLSNEMLKEQRENSTFVALHEMAHLLQFKRGLSPGGAWQMEPHADFLAGWAYANSFVSPDWLTKMEMGMHIDEGAVLMFSLGDTAFNDPRHHGEPQFRAAMVRAGFDSANLGLDEAFERGKKYAGLQ